MTLEMSLNKDFDRIKLDDSEWRRNATHYLTIWG